MSKNKVYLPGGVLSLPGVSFALPSCLAFMEKPEYNKINRQSLRITWEYTIMEKMY